MGEQVIRRKIPIRIKNVENPRGGGTVIDPEADAATDPLPDFGAAFVDGMLTNAHVNGTGTVPRQRQRLPTAVTIKERIVVLNVQSNRKSVSHGFLAGIFGTLDRFGVVVDLISTSEVFVSMAIEDILDRKLQARLVRDLEKIGIVRRLVLLPPNPLLSTMPLTGVRFRPLRALSFERYPCIATWRSCRWWAGTCATWSASPDACSRRSRRAT